MNKQPLESDLHAYVDGRLDVVRRAEVEAWLAANAEDAVRVADWQRQKEALHRRFDPVLEEMVPERLLQAGTGRGAFAYRSLGGMAAALAWVVVGGMAGYFVRGPGEAGSAPLASRAITHQAALAHAVFVPEVRHPVEVGADQEAHLVQWLSKRLGTSIRAPSLQASGFKLMGGRLLPGEAGPAAQFMYQDAGGRRVTLYLRTKATGGTGTAFRFARENGLSAFYWVDGSVGYALVGDLKRDELLGLAESAYRGLDGGGAAAPDAGKDRPA